MLLRRGGIRIEKRLDREVFVDWRLLVNPYFVPKIFEHVDSETSRLID